MIVGFSVAGAAQAATGNTPFAAARARRLPAEPQLDRRVDRDPLRQHRHGHPRRDGARPRDADRHPHDGRRGARRRRWTRCSTTIPRRGCNATGGGGGSGRHLAALDADPRRGRVREAGAAEDGLDQARRSGREPDA